MSDATTEKPKPVKSLRRRNLNTLGDIRYRLAKVLRALERGDELMTPDRARAYIYGCKVLADIMQGADIEERLARLESERSTTEQPLAVQ